MGAGHVKDLCPSPLRATPQGDTVEVGRSVQIDRLVQVDGHVNRKVRYIRAQLTAAGFRV